MRLICLALVASACACASDCPTADLDSPDTRDRFHELDKKAQVEFRNGEYAQSAEDFRQGACLAPDDLRMYYTLYGTAIGALAAGNLPSAIEFLKEADRLRPDYPLPLAMLVKISLQSPHPDQVKEFLRLAADRFPRAGKLHAEFVKDLLHQNRLDLALAEALRFEQSGVPDIESVLTLAVIENNAGAFGDAAQHGQAVEQQSGLPADVRASGATVAGLAYENLKQFPEAIEHLKRASELAPAREDLYLYLARVYGKQQNAQAAVEVLDQGSKQIAGSQKIRLALGADLVAVEKYAQASQILAEVIRNSPDELEAYPTLADAYGKMGQPKLATETLRALAARKPDYPMVHLAIAQSLLNDEPVDAPRVSEELALADKTSPDDYDVWYLRGKVCLRMNKVPEAIASLRRAIELRPADSSAYYQLALAYRKSGQATLAKRQFEIVEYLKSQ
ncbi:MAG TPA: tetratricopeptide repeat protein [Bryobacteraceae bacterium]|nr:tetratricopeptide repeat protein [Bryobacteraceae bacterium]